ncbi:hypothetical protein FOZ62_026386 [Perkinsus olseni]|nr:hypothetical protein FOZ62_026386 [Perkinsus olseni]
MIELFKYQLMVYPMGEAGDTLTIYLQRVPMDGVDPRFVYENVDYEISIMNHRDDQVAMTRGKVKGSFAADARVRGFEKDIIDQVLRSAYVDGDGGMVIKSRVDLNNSRLSPAEGSPNEEGFWIEDIADFKKGEDMKFRPSWIGNYRTRVKHLFVRLTPMLHDPDPRKISHPAPYPSRLWCIQEGILTMPMARRGWPYTYICWKARSWVGTFQPDGAGDDSWGPNRLLSVADLRDDSKGWLDSDGELLLMISVESADEGRDPLSFTKSSAKKRRISVKTDGE